MLTDRQCDVISAMAFGRLSVYRAAQIMGCNRGTVVFHIEQIKKKTGLDAMDFFDLVELFKIAGGEADAEKNATVSAALSSAPPWMSAKVFEVHKVSR